MHKLESAVAAHAEADIVQPAPGVVAGSKKHRSADALAVTHPEDFGGRPREVLLDVFKVDVFAGMPAGVVPILEHVGVAIDDHSGSSRAYGLCWSRNTACATLRQAFP